MSGECLVLQHCMWICWTRRLCLLWFIASCWHAILIFAHNIGLVWWLRRGPLRLSTTVEYVTTSVRSVVWQLVVPIICHVTSRNVPICFLSALLYWGFRCVSYKAQMPDLPYRLAMPLMLLQVSNRYIAVSLCKSVRFSATKTVPGSKPVAWNTALCVVNNTESCPWQPPMEVHWTEPLSQPNPRAVSNGHCPRIARLCGWGRDLVLLSMQGAAPERTGWPVKCMPHVFLFWTHTFSEVSLAE